MRGLSSYGGVSEAMDARKQSVTAVRRVRSIRCLFVQAYMPKPTWSNHHNIWRDAGVEFGEYTYYKPETCGLNFEGLIQDLKVSLLSHHSSREDVSVGNASREFDPAPRLCTQSDGGRSHRR